MPGRGQAGAGRWSLVLVLALGVALGTILSNWFAQESDPERAAQPQRIEPVLGNREAAIELQESARSLVPAVVPAPLAETRPDSERWIPRLDSSEGGGRTPDQIFQAFWKGRHVEADFPPDYRVVDPSPWDGYLGDADKCLVLLRDAIVQAYRDGSIRGGPEFQVLGTSFGGIEEGVVDELLRRRKRLSWPSPSEVDRESQPYRALLEFLREETRNLSKMRQHLVNVKAEAIRADVAGLDAWVRPTRGHLHFSPIHARNTFKPEVKARIRQPMDLWSEQFPIFGVRVSPECRVFNAVYLADWQDFPEVAAEIENVLAFLAALGEDLDLRLQALPRI